MKGLLIKDYRILLGQKKFLGIVALVAFSMSFVMKDPGFLAGYVTFVISFFTINSLAYDEMDNGYSFLFTLPVSRGTYVKAKYAFALINSLLVYVLMTGISAFIILTINKGTNQDVLTGMEGSLSFLIGSLVILALMIPIQLKFGNEKARIAVFGVAAVITVVFFTAKTFATKANVDVKSILDFFTGRSIPELILIFTIAVIVVFTVSVAFSLGILKKKQF